MRALSFALFAALTTTGCAVDSTPSDEEETEASTDALSAYGESLTGAYKLVSGPADFTWIVLRANGTFFTEQQIVCVRAPCINPRTEGKFTASRPVKGSSVGKLRLVARGGAVQNYRVSTPGDHTGFKLSSNGTTWATFDTVGTLCNAATDCSGQSYMHIMCVGSATCDTTSRTCGWRCGSPVPTAECTTNADCRTFDDYCTGCDCRALSTSAPNPTCSGPGVRCFAQPCMGKTATCSAGRCVVSPAASY